MLVWTFFPGRVDDPLIPIAVVAKIISKIFTNIEL